MTPFRATDKKGAMTKDILRVMPYEIFPKGANSQSKGAALRNALAKLEEAG